MYNTTHKKLYIKTVAIKERRCFFILTFFFLCGILSTEGKCVKLNKIVNLNLHNRLSIKIDSKMRAVSTPFFSSEYAVKALSFYVCYLVKR